jgi:isopentenyl diphosphate isomerase/L-lactate dehydrogenase-like FMN-dependent dehydrogenase
MAGIANALTEIRNLKKEIAILKRKIQKMESVETFKGAGDRNVSGIVLYNHKGQKVYVYPNSDGDGVDATLYMP